MTSDLKGAFEHRPIHTLRRFYIFMRRTTPAEPSEPIEPAPPLSQTIKGRPEGRALNPISLFSTVSPGELFLYG